MMVRHSTLLLIGLLFLLVFIPVSLAQPLPISSWYAVVYQPETDALLWVNAAGQQSTMPRPILPGETEFRDLRISPNGRTMVMVSRLNNGSEGLGVYDFASGTFVQTHQAQPSESINLGGENIFAANSQYFAVGFFSGDFASPAWRVILFESQTGNAIAFIDHTHPDAPKVQLSAPAVQYLDGTYVHFQLIPQAVGGSSTWPAYAWRVVGYDPSAPAISASPYTNADTQVQLLTGKTVMSYADANFAAAPQNGPTPAFNAIGTSVLANGTPLTPVHADSTRYHLKARWANGGNWILFQSDDVQGNRYWNIVLADGTPGNNSHIPFDPQFVSAYGTSDGYLLLNSANSLFYSNGFAPNTALNIAQLSPSARVVYVTPIGVNFMLDQLPGINQQPGIVTPPPAPVIVTPAAPEPVAPQPAACATALSPRVFVGGMGRVLTSPTLNVRQQPSGAILTTFTTGTTFNIIGGAVCSEDLYWWQIERFGTIGWVAEGVAGSYLIEPYAGPMSEDITPTPDIVISPVPPAEELPEGVPQPVCDGALPARLSIGTSALVIHDELRVYNGPAGEVLARSFFLTGTPVVVNAGPECSGGQNWWLVSGQARIGRFGQNMDDVQGWVSEGANGSYYLAP